MQTLWMHTSVMLYIILVSPSLRYSLSLYHYILLLNYIQTQWHFHSLSFFSFPALPSGPLLRRSCSLRANMSATMLEQRLVGNTRPTLSLLYVKGVDPETGRGKRESAGKSSLGVHRTSPLAYKWRENLKMVNETQVKGCLAERHCTRNNHPLYLKEIGAVHLEGHQSLGQHPHDRKSLPHSLAIPA